MIGYLLLGNSIVDAVETKLKEKPEESIFDIYSDLEEDEWIRVDIHMRSNLSRRRFFAIFEGVLNLVEMGYNIVWIELPAIKFALEKYGLRKKLIKLSEEKKNFLFTGLWKYYAHVIEFISSDHFLAELTDSGSMQEELNYLSKPCLTVRFNTDRPETVFEARSNLLVPPYSGGFFSGFVTF